MVPTKLEDWTLDVVRNLLATRAFENESFDFKEGLPDTRNAADKLDLTLDCAAFANSRGGFLLFGVKDNKSLSTEERLIGLAASDLPALFGSYPSRCSPSVNWKPTPAGLTLPTGRLLHVVQIEQSWKAPHAVELPGQTGTYRFPKRTNKGTEYMTINEVQSMFLGLQERRSKLDLIRSELDFALRQAQDIVSADLRNATLVKLVRFDLSLLQTVIGETYTLLMTAPALMKALYEVRRQAAVMNRLVDEYAVRLLEPIGPIPRQQMARNQNADVWREAGSLVASIAATQGLLTQLIGEP